MLFARAMTNGARVHCPEVFVGAVYTPDELVDGEVVPEPQEEPQRVPEAAEAAPAEALPDAEEEAVPVVHIYPTTEAQAAEVRRLLSASMQRGMTSAHPAGRA